MMGTLLLMLPAATVSGTVPFIDALFTSTSAVCVTGLIVVDTGSYYTVFGQAVILLLIQAGGLGIMTLSVFFFRQVGRGVSLHQRRIIQDLYAHTPRGDIWELLRVILLFTLVSEGIGFLVLLLTWGGGDAALPVFSALFHAVSAFCNAGFSLHADSLERFSGSAAVSITVAFLIILGGLGFPVIYDIMRKIEFRKVKGYRLSTQTKTVLSVSLTLIAGGTLLIFLLEFNGVLKEMGWGEKILSSFFQSVTCRTAGFNTIGISALGSATLVLMIFLMFVGASPGSCGGG
jgi:trk system potassium uptake protein